MFIPVFSCTHFEVVTDSPVEILVYPIVSSFVFSRCENRASGNKVVNSFYFLTTEPTFGVCSDSDYIFLKVLGDKALVLSRKYKFFSLRLQSRAGEPLVSCFSINIIIFTSCCKLSMQRFFLPAELELFHTFMFFNFF